MEKGRIVIVAGAPGTGKAQYQQSLLKNLIWKNLCICIPTIFIIILERDPFSPFTGNQTNKT